MLTALNHIQCKEDGKIVHCASGVQAGEELHTPEGQRERKKTRCQCVVNSFISEDKMGIG